jgi:hypothetical protein
MPEIVIPANSTDCRYPKRDMAGQRFGKLEVVEFAGLDKWNYLVWKCRCDCGRDTLVVQAMLLRKRNGVRSCGCAKIDALKHRAKHGMSASPEFRIWAAMWTRCTNPRQSHWMKYGGRGITICERWKSFANFYADMGPKPSPEHSIDRRDNNKGYEPSNCRWATQVEQMNNTSRSAKVEYLGRVETITKWAEILGINYSSLRARYQRGDQPPRLFRPMERQSTAKNQAQRSRLASRCHRGSDPQPQFQSGLLWPS